MKNKAFRLIALPAIIFSAGCEDDTRIKPALNPNETEVCVMHVGCSLVTMHTLTDGTRCAVLLGYKKGGISCDWGAAALQSMQPPSEGGP